MPYEMLHGDSSDVLRELASQGLPIMAGPSVRTYLVAYLQTWKTDARVMCVDRLGWRATVFCLPSETVGSNGLERVVFQPSSSIQAEHAMAGTLTEWRDGVAALASGNTRLVFALSTAFTGPLLELAGEDSGGLHFVGASSCGKTTALRVAASQRFLDALQLSATLEL
jgi:putative DNA primase/helicase